MQTNRLLSRMQETQLYLLLRVFNVPLPQSITSNNIKMYSDQIWVDFAQYVEIIRFYCLLSPSCDRGVLSYLGEMRAIRGYLLSLT